MSFLFVNLDNLMTFSLFQVFIDLEGIFIHRTLMNTTTNARGSLQHQIYTSSPPILEYLGCGSSNTRFSSIIRIGHFKFPKNRGVKLHRFSIAFSFFIVENCRL